MIPVIADIPSAKPGLGFEEYAEAIADAVRGGQPPQFTIGLYGAWGTGKSSLLNAIAHNLKEGQEVPIIPVLFDAWRYERTDHIIVPMLHSIYSSVQEHGERKILKQLTRAIRSVMYGLTFNLSYPGGPGVEISPQTIKENWDSEELPELDQVFSQPFSELRKMPDVLKGHRIVVLIDDLDRCSPEKVVSVLESINLVMDVPGFIFILALDYEVLVEAIKSKYPSVNGHRFIEKMVQLSFRVPPLSLEEAKFLDELIPNWSSWKSNLPEDFSNHIRDISELGLNANPRQIKRLINSFLVLQQVINKRDLGIDLEFAAALIGIQLGWPDDYREFEKSVLSGSRSHDSDPLQLFKDQARNESLRRYAERLLNTDVVTSDIRRILQLTSAVTVDEKSR